MSHTEKLAASSVTAVQADDSAPRCDGQEGAPDSTLRTGPGAPPRQPYWLTDPTDGLTHGWCRALGRHEWQALCGRVADPRTLTDPEDEYGRHDGCLLKLGERLAATLPQGTEWR